MQTTDEDTTDDAPQEHGNPTENGSLDGAVDGASACDGGEVMAHQNSGLSGDVVDTVVHFDSGSLARGIYAPLLSQPCTIGHVTDDQQDDCSENDQNSSHFSLLSFFIADFILPKSFLRIWPIRLKTRRPVEVSIATTR